MYNKKCDCGGRLEGYEIGTGFCSHCGKKEERYLIEDKSKLNLEMNSAGIVLSFLGIMTGFTFAIFFLFFKPQIVGLTKLVTYFSVITSISILLLLCFFLMNIVIGLKKGYLNSLNWLEDVLHILYIPLVLMLSTLLLISWKIHWIYALLCFLTTLAMFIFIKFKISYEEDINKYIKRINKMKIIDNHHINLIEKWISFLIDNKIINNKKSTNLYEKLEKLKDKQKEH